MKFALNQSVKEAEGGPALSFFLNTRKDALQKSTTGAYRSLLLQLLVEISRLQNLFQSSEYRDNFVSQSYNELTQCCSSHLTIDVELSLEIADRLVNGSPYRDPKNHDIAFNTNPTRTLNSLFHSSNTDPSSINRG